MASEGYHEPAELLDEPARDMHRALRSLMEELEAIDWYHQRVVATRDPELASILAHHRDEEIEHASMLVEWLRRTSPRFDAELRTYLFKTEPVTQIEAPAAAPVVPTAAAAVAPAGGGSLGIGSLR